MIVLTETLLKSEDDGIDILGFNEFYLIRTRKIGGGCNIMVDSSLECSLLPNLCIESEFFENIAVEINTNQFTYTILGVYRPRFIVFEFIRF